MQGLEGAILGWLGRTYYYSGHYYYLQISGVTEGQIVSAARTLLGFWETP
jgi:hypothetical protein